MAKRREREKEGLAERRVHGEVEKRRLARDWLKGAMGREVESRERIRG